MSSRSIFRLMETLKQVPCGRDGFFQDEIRERRQCEWLGPRRTEPYLTKEGARDAEPAPISAVAVRKLRAAGRHGRVRKSVPRVRRELPQNGELPLKWYSHRSRGKRLLERSKLFRERETRLPGDALLELSDALGGGEWRAYCGDSAVLQLTSCNATSSQHRQGCKARGAKRETEEVSR